MGNLLDPTEDQQAHMAAAKERRTNQNRRRPPEDLSLLEKIREWCRGRSANARLPLGIWFALLFVLYFYNQDGAANIDILNAGLHKLGHFLWAMIDPDTPVAGGWLLQFGVPIIAMIAFWRSFDCFGVAITFAWLGSALLWNAPYCLRAPAEQFPPSVLQMNEPIHDWNYLLSYFQTLSDAPDISWWMRWGGLLSLAFAVYFLGSQLYFMYTLEERRKEADRRLAAISAGR